MAYDKVVDSAELDTGLESIAVAIRSKTGSSLKLDFPTEFVSAVNGIATRKPEQEKSATATKNGPVVLTPDNGKVLSKATVNVAVPSDKKPEQTKSVTYTTNGKRTVSPDSGKVLSGVTVDVNVPTGLPYDVFESIMDRTVTDFNENVKSLGESALRGCIKLRTLTLPAAVSIGDYACRYDDSLERVETGATAGIGKSAFEGCAKLNTFIIDNSVVCPLAERALNKTGIAAGTGYIYVRKAVMEQYKNDAGWKPYASRILAIEDNPGI